MLEFLCCPLFITLRSEMKPTGSVQVELSKHPTYGSWTWHSHRAACFAACGARQASTATNAAEQAPAQQGVGWHHFGMDVVSACGYVAMLVLVVFRALAALCIELIWQLLSVLIYELPRLPVPMACCF